MRIVGAVLTFVFLALSFAKSGGAQAPAGGTPARIVSLVPALTEMLYEIGAGPQVVAVSRFDAYPAEVTALPRIGGLLDPDYEGILKLTPDLVLTYGSQSELERRLTAGGIRFYSYRHAGLAGVFQTMDDLGAATNRVDGARTAIARLRARLEEVRARVRGLNRPSTLLVFGRQAGTLRQLYASGGSGFMHELFDIAGGANVLADLSRESAQPSIEMVLARAPEVIVELHAGSAPSASVIASERALWARLASVPAVRNNRVHLLYGDFLTIPGPRLGRAAEVIARTIHPAAFR
jgi:iron complex transport system substrate-binding protein